MFHVDINIWYDESIMSMLDQNNTSHDDNNIIIADIIIINVAEIKADETSLVDAVFLFLSLLSLCTLYIM